MGLLPTDRGIDYGNFKSCPQVLGTVAPIVRPVLGRGGSTHVTGFPFPPRSTCSDGRIASRAAGMVRRPLSCPPETI